MVATQIYVFYVVPYLGFFDSRGWITPLSHSHICTGFGIWGPFIWWILALQPWPFCWSSDVSFVAYPFVACGTWDNKNRRPCHAGKRKFKRNLQEIAVRLAGRDFCWDPCLTIIFLRVPAEFVFLFFSTCSTIMVLGSWSPQEEWIPNSQDWTYVDVSRVLWKRKRNSWLDPPPKKKLSWQEERTHHLEDVSHIKKRVDFTAIAMLVPGWLYDPLQVAQRSQVQNLPTQRFEKCPSNPMLPRRSPR